MVKIPPLGFAKSAPFDKGVNQAAVLQRLLLQNPIMEPDVTAPVRGVKLAGRRRRISQQTRNKNYTAKKCSTGTRHGR